MRAGTASSAVCGRPPHRLHGPYHMVDAEDVRVDLAPWWPLLSAPADYEEEAAFFGDALSAAADRPPRTVLELGSGGGNNASHLKARFDMVLVEPSEGMRAVSRALNPECEHVDGDMRTVEARPAVRRRLRPRCRVLHDDRIRFAHGDRDRVRALQTWWRRALRAGFRPRELQPRRPIMADMTIRPTG